MTEHAKLTIRDVARKAGVSVGTVSRVLNRNMSVQADIRQRVHHAIETPGLRREFRRAQHAQPRDTDHRLHRTQDQRSAACGIRPGGS